MAISIAVWFSVEACDRRRKGGGKNTGRCSTSSAPDLYQSESSRKPGQEVDSLLSSYVLLLIEKNAVNCDETAFK